MPGSPRRTMLLGRRRPAVLRLRGRLPRARGVVVEAAPALAAEAAGRDQLLLQQRGRIARVVEVRLVTPTLVTARLTSSADQVHQLEGPHAEAAGLAQDGIDRRGVGARRSASGRSASP